MNRVRRWHSTLALAAALGAVPPVPSAVSEELSSPGPLGSALHFLNQMAEPGPLARAHAHLDNDASCIQCHDTDEGVPDGACLACHAVVAERRVQRAGWHGLTEGRCVECHTDHVSREADIMPFDHMAFNHERAVFRLEGAHRDLECAQCHVEHASPESGGWQFLGLAQACAACHESPHRDALAAECRQCHGQERWEDVRDFDHERDTAFALTGAHRALECSACHGDDLTFAAHGIDSAAVTAAFRCSACHENPHREARFTSCQQCHETAAWRPAQFDHAQTAFPLIGQHRLAECSQCHRGEGDFTLTGHEGQRVLAPFDCASCHENIHRDPNLTSCRRCHTPAGWQPVAFNHETMTDFPLAALHAGLTCQECHGPAVGEPENTFHARGAQCAACHADIETVLSGARFTDTLGHAQPDVHHRVIQCEECHSTQDERTHLSVIAPRCVACHTPSHGQMLFDEARLVEQSLQGQPRDNGGRLTTGPFAGLRGSDLLHNAAAWLTTPGAVSPD